MCFGCYQEYGLPVVLSQLTNYAVDLIDKVYSEDVVGGGCHIVIDDWNLSDDTIDSTISNNGYLDEGLTPTERECLEVLRGMSLDERATALALYDGFIAHPGELATDRQPQPQ